MAQEFHLTTTGTFVLQSTGGNTLDKIVLNTTGAGTATIYDSPTASGKVIAVETFSATTPPGDIEYGVPLNNGLTIVVASAALDLTVVLGT
jgi:hypothetical protein